MSKDDGGPAFPSRGGMFFYVPEESKGDIQQALADLDREFAGISVRDYFAGRMEDG